MKNWFLSLSFLLVFFGSCSKGGHNYVIDVELNGLDKPVFAVHQSYNGKIKVDTLFANGGFFRIKGSSDSLAQVRVTDPGGSKLFTLFVKNGDRLRVEGKMSDLYDLSISGSSLNKELQKFRKSQAQTIKNQLETQMERIHTGVDMENRIRQLDQKQDSLQASIREEISRYVGKNNSDPLSAVLIYDYLLDERFPQAADSLFSRLKSDAKEGIPLITNQIKAFSQRVKKGLPGTELPRFKLHDIQDSLVTSAICEERPAVLYFWSPRGAGVQLNDMRTLAQLKEFYGDSAVAVLSIAVYSDTAVWRSFLSTRPIDAINLIEPQEFGSELTDLLGVRSLPTAIIVDKQGVVDNRQLRGMDLIDRVKILIEQEFVPRDQNALAVEKLLRERFGVSFPSKDFYYTSDGKIASVSSLLPDDGTLQPIHPDSIRPRLKMLQWADTEKAKKK